MPAPPPTRSHSWVVFWTAIGSLAAVAGVVVAAIALRADPPQPPSPVGTGQEFLVDSGEEASTVAPTPVAYGEITVPAGTTAYVYELPQSTSTVVGTLASGTVVTIYCTWQGESMTRTDGLTSSLWNRIDGGYVPDVDVYTGTSQATAPSCAL